MNFFTSKEIKPAGWLAAQLRVQADGLCGNLDRVWGDVRDSMWIGGEREGSGESSLLARRVYPAGVSA